VRNKIDHPVVDVDGHQAPLAPGFDDYLADAGGPGFVERYYQHAIAQDPQMMAAWRLSADERRDQRAIRGAWWGTPSRNTLDRATSNFPRLLHERMDEIGLDFTTLYAGGLFTLPFEDDEDVRRLGSRAMNRFQADLYRPYEDRMTVVAVIPMHTPEEAIEELVHAVEVCGLKAIAIPPGVRRPIPALQRVAPDAYPLASWWDTYGLDSRYDYDPFWQRCIDLKVAVTAHGGVVPGPPLHGGSISNYVANHIGTHAYQQSLLCKSLFLGGVTRRFPKLNFAFLECGVGWACSLYSDLISHWDKRNRTAVEDLNPANIDRELYLRLGRDYGTIDSDDELQRALTRLDFEPTVDPDALDEWRNLGITNKAEFSRLFADNFYFGCEADDPMNATAFNRQVNPFGARLQAVFSSDISHWDVPNMAEVVDEAYELVEHGIITEDDFKDFVFRNPVRLHAGMNPEFFKGTPVAKYVSRVLRVEQDGIAGDAG
jgi:predicted TIM-barrel fold metal-dependent hydrolase